jgi:outer membrane lipoprotein-sorting protein
MKNRRLVLFSLLGALLAQNLYSSNASAAALEGSARQEAIIRANNAINSLTRIEGDFIQINPNQTSNSGKFWLNRPGKMRFEYGAPSQLLLVSDGSDVIIVDKRLKTTERYPLRSTPLYFLLKSNVNLSQDVLISSVESANGKLILICRDRQNQANGELRIVFSSNMRLEEWSIKDRQNRVTHVRISNTRNSGAQPASQFYVPLPKRPANPKSR